MARAILPIEYDQHLTLVEHLDELRTRIIVSLAFVAVAFAVCFWQHHALLHLLEHPLSKELGEAQREGDRGPGADRDRLGGHPRSAGPSRA